MSQVLDEALNDLKLNEAFADSMPKWIKDRMIYLVRGRNYRTFDKYPELRNQKAVDYSNRYEGPTNLFTILTNAGYNLSKMEFTNVDVPNSINDELFENPDALTFVHYVSDNDDKIWVPGINDEERFIGDDGRYHKFGAFNNSNFKKYAKHIVQADLNADTTHLSNYTLNKDKELGTLYNGKPLNYGWYTMYDNATQSQKITDKNVLNRRASKKDSYNTDLFDKSGYFRGSTQGQLSTRLKAELNKIKNKKIPELVIKTENEIKDLNDMISNYVQSQIKNISITDYSTSTDLINTITRRYINLMSSFNNLKWYLDRDVERIKNNPDRDFSTDTVNQLKTVNDNINEIKNVCSGYEKTFLVW